MTYDAIVVGGGPVGLAFALAASRLQAFLPALPMAWVVVENDGTAIVERWRAP